MIETNRPLLFSNPAQEIFELLKDDRIVGCPAAVASLGVLSSFTDQDLLAALAESSHAAIPFTLGNCWPTVPGIASVRSLPDKQAIDSKLVEDAISYQSRVATAWTLVFVDAPGPDQTRSVLIVLGCDGRNMVAGRVRVAHSDGDCRFVCWDQSPGRVRLVRHQKRSQSARTWVRSHSITAARTSASSHFLNLRVTV